MGFRVFKYNSAVEAQAGIFLPFRCFGPDQQPSSRNEKIISGLSVVSLPWPKSLSLTQQPETNKNPKNIISNIFFLERTGAPATTFACRALSYSFLFDLLFISLCYTPLFGSLRPICHLFRPVNQFFFPLTASYCVSFTFHFARKFNSIQISFING